MVTKKFGACLGFVLLSVLFLSGFVVADDDWSVEITSPENGAFWNEGNAYTDGWYYFEWAYEGISKKNLGPWGNYSINDNSYFGLDSQGSKHLFQLSDLNREGWNNLTVRFCLENSSSACQTATSVFFLDDVPPILEIASPLDEITYTNKTSIGVKAVVYEKYLKKYWDEENNNTEELRLDIRGPNIGTWDTYLGNNSEETRDLNNDGEYTFTFFARDYFPDENNTINHEVNKMKIIVRDTIPPIIDATFPIPNSLLGKNIWINVSVEDNTTVTEDVSGIKNITIEIINSTGTIVLDKPKTNNNFENTLDFDYNWNSSEFEDGIYNISISSFDRAGNNATKILRNITIDNHPPILTLNKSSKTLEFGRDNVTINWSATDEGSDINKTILNITNQDGELVFNSSEDNDTITLTPKDLKHVGNYNITLWAKDRVGNENSTSISFEVKDTVPPEFTFVPNNTFVVYGESWKGVQFNATDNYGIEDWSVNDSNFAINEKGFLSLTGNLSVREYYVDVSVRDSYGNINSTIYNLNVTKRPIEITANDAEKIYGNEDPELKYYDSNGSLASWDSLSDFKGLLEREKGENIEIYTITQGNLTNPNYNITFVNGMLNITKRPIELTADNKIIFEYESDPELTFRNSTPLASWDEFSGELNRTEGNESGTHDILQGNLTITNDSNYDITFVAGSFTILANLSNEGNFTHPDLTNETDISNVSNFYVENEFGKINWTEAIDFSSGFDWTKHISIIQNEISVNISGEGSVFNKSAVLTFYNVSWEKVEFCYGENCETHDEVNGTLGVSVEGFFEDAYTVSEYVASSSSGPSGGGGGRSSTNYYRCIEWGEWSECSPEGFQTRECDQKERVIYSQRGDLEETRECLYLEEEIIEELEEPVEEILEEETEEEVVEEETGGFFAGIGNVLTGAAVGVGGFARSASGMLMVLVVFLLLSGTLIALRVRRRRLQGG